MAHNYSKHELVVAEIAEKYNIKKKDVMHILSEYTDAILENLTAGELCRIPRLGTLFSDRYGYHFHAAEHLMKEFHKKGR